MPIWSYPSESEQAFCSLATRASPYTQLTIALHSLLCCSHNDCFSVPQICHIPPCYHHICSMPVVSNFFGTRDQFSGRQLFPRTGGEMVSERFKCIPCIAHFILIISVLPWLPGWHSGKEPTCQCRRHGLDSWIRKIPWTESDVVLTQTHKQRKSGHWGPEPGVGQWFGVMLEEVFAGL